MYIRSRLLLYILVDSITLNSNKSELWNRNKVAFRFYVLVVGNVVNISQGKLKLTKCTKQTTKVLTSCEVKLIVKTRVSLLFELVGPGACDVTVTDGSVRRGFDHRALLLLI